MKFTKESEIYLNFLINDFENLITKNSDINQTKLDTILRVFFNDFFLAEHYIKQQKREGNFERKILTTKDIKHSSLALSSYVPLKIKKVIEKKKGNVLQYNCIVIDHKVEINFIIYNDTESDNLFKFDRYAELMFMWLKIAFFYSNPSCSKELVIFIYMTKDKKFLPDSQMKILSPNNCNSAVTIGCSKKGEIVIYREEEWFKVFIHETFHSLGLDFGTYSTVKFEKNFKDLFPIKMEFNIFEGYAEFWATVINCLFCSYNILDDKNNFDNFVLYFKFCIRFEQLFSLVQCAKILNFMGLNFKNLYLKDSISKSVRKYLYKEKTNVFAYYILKCVLLYNYHDFLFWCDRNNANLISFYRSESNLMNFFDFVKSNHNDPNFLTDLKKMSNMLRDIKGSAFYTQSDKDKFLTTTRMTVCELVKDKID